MGRPLVILLMSILLFNCSNVLEQADYVKWVKDYKNGLHIKSVNGDFIFDLQYQPKEYLSLLTDKPGQDSLQYYVLNVSLVDPTIDLFEYNVSDTGEKQTRLYYFSYLFQDHIYLEEGESRFPCVLFHFENSSLDNGRTFVLGFERSTIDNLEMSKVVVDSPYFGAIPVKLKIVKENIPSLKL